ncbi:hypothetical protein [Pelosinus sp. sgz500959]|uniref:hypothetical protein n=1 Tax=Pelosinus sp. sgz500959 TaxID=3242472 RepID=UPI00366C17D2
MSLKPDFQDALQLFIFSNFPILMNPLNAMNVVVSNDILPTPTVSVSATSTIDTTSVIVITPEIVKAIQSYVLNNFPNIGLPQDIQEVAKAFFANLPPLIPIAPNVEATANAVTTATSTTS